MDMIAIKTKAKVTCAKMWRSLESTRFSSPRSRLNSDQERGVRALETDGAYVTSLDELGVPFDGACKAEIEQLYEKISFKSHGRKSFRGVVPREAIEQSHNLLLWGLNEALLNVVESYLRVPANFRGFLATLDLADGDETETRRWHIDAADTRSFKMIIYLNDVGPDNGPFEFSPLRFGPKFARSDFVEGRIPDEIMERSVPRAEWITCTGMAGTVVVADTCRIFHRGKPPISGTRKAMFFPYTTRRPPNPENSARLFDASAFSKGRTGMTPRQRQAIGLNTKRGLAPY